VNDLWYNFQKPYFQDKRARQALLYAIDRASIIKSLYKDTAVITNTVLPNPRWATASGLNAFPYDPDKAKQLLKDAGWDQSRTLELLFYYPDKLTTDALTAMQQYWAAVGVKVTPRLVDSPTLVKLTYQEGNFDFFYGGSAGGPEPDILSPYFLCDNVFPKGSNAGRYCNPELDKLLDAGRVTVGFDERKKIYDQVQKILNDDPVWEVLWQPVRYAVVDKKFANFAWHQFGGDTNFNSRPNTWFVQG
jgi:peptide/nickel transport system substrate-binding protein